MNGKASKARFFALDEPTTVALLREAGLLDSDGVHVRIVFSNPSREFAARRAIVEFDPPYVMTFFSLHHDTPRDTAAAVVRKSLRSLQGVSRSTLSERGNSQATVVVYWEAAGSLQVIERRIFFQQRKYRHAEKYSNACKPRKLRVEEVPIAT